MNLLSGFSGSLMCRLYLAPFIRCDKPSPCSLTPTTSIDLYSKRKNYWQPIKMNNLSQIIVAVVSGSAFTAMAVYFGHKFKRQTDLESNIRSDFDSLTKELGKHIERIENRWSADTEMYLARLQECEDRCNKCESEHNEAKAQITEQAAEIDDLYSRVNALES